jgi:hypothetical protein
MPTREISRVLKTFFLTLVIIIVLLIIVSYVLTMLIGPELFFFTSEGLALSTQFLYFHIFLFLFIGFYIPFALPAGIVFFSLWCIYALCFIMAWKWRESFHKVVRKSFSRPLRSIFNNFLFAMPIISSMTLTAALAIIYFQEVTGVPTGQPQLPSNIYEILLVLAYAPVVEEIGFRLIPIGLIVIIYVFLTSRKNRSSLEGLNSFKLFFTALIYPENAKKMVGLKTLSEHGFWKGTSRGEWVMILVTSAFFGLTHVLSGGWEAGKFTSVFVQGLVFALSYVAYGFEAPILLHWFFDYYLFFFDPEIVGKLLLATDILSIVEIVTLIVGILSWVAFAVAGFRKLLRSKTKEKVSPPAPAAAFIARE